MPNAKEKIAKFIHNSLLKVSIPFAQKRKDKSVSRIICVVSLDPLLLREVFPEADCRQRKSGQPGPQALQPGRGFADICMVLQTFQRNRCKYRSSAPSSNSQRTLEAETLSINSKLFHKTNRSKYYSVRITTTRECSTTLRTPHSTTRSSASSRPTSRRTQC